MSRRSVSRLFTAAWVVLSLLFSQLALASYVCPTDSGETQPAMEMAPGEPCAGLASDPEQTVLCHRHCTELPQSFDALKLPTATVPAVVQVLVLPLVLDGAEQRAIAYDSSAVAQPPPGPVFLATLRLRV